MDGDLIYIAFAALIAQRSDPRDHTKEDASTEVPRRV